MDNALLISLSRQIALQRQMDVVANNLANTNTTGFKAEKILFEEYVAPAESGDTASIPTVDRFLSFTQDWATVHDLSSGPIKQTGNELDIALDGDGFIAVQTPAGERYTRNGAFQIDATGTLVTQEGYPVLADGGQIRFDPAETDIAFLPDGTVASSAGVKGRLQIVEFANRQELVREGENLFSGGQPAAATATRVVHGALESSNVASVTEMTTMIRVTRAYQSLAQLMQRQDDLRRTAIGQLGDLSA